MPIQIRELSAGAEASTSDADIFLDVQARRAGKIKGEGGTAGHVDDIHLHTWRWGVASASAIGSGAATSRRQYRPLVVTKGLDTASTGLLNALVGNDELKSVKLTMRKAGGEALDYFLMTLQGGRVIDVDVEVDASGRPVERVTIAFTKIAIDYRAQQSDGSGGATYSFSDEVLATS